MATPMSAPTLGHVRVADFTFLEKLGQGSYGVVYKVKHSNGALYVIKQINIAMLTLKEQDEAINEVRVLSRLKNEFVVNYYGSSIENDVLNIVMELAESGSLNDKLKQRNGKKLPEEQIWHYFIQICLGLYHIHSKRILHRDLKTMNIFLSKNDTVKIGDLGVAKMMSTATKYAHTMVGTPYYLSPELCEDKPYNEKSDVWAVGVVLYELCTLQHPFDAQNQGALILKIIRGKYPPIGPGYSSRLADVVDRCLTRNSAARPHIAALLTSPPLVSNATNLQLMPCFPSALRASITADYLPAAVPPPPSAHARAVAVPSAFSSRPSAKQHQPPPPTASRAAARRTRVQHAMAASGHAAAPRDANKIRGSRVGRVAAAAKSTCNALHAPHRCLTSAARASAAGIPFSPVAIAIDEHAIPSPSTPPSSSDAHLQLAPQHSMSRGRRVSQRGDVIEDGTHVPPNVPHPPALAAAANHTAGAPGAWGASTAHSAAHTEVPSDAPPVRRSSADKHAPGAWAAGGQGQGAGVVDVAARPSVDKLLQMETQLDLSIRSYSAAPLQQLRLERSLKSSSFAGTSTSHLASDRLQNDSSPLGNPCAKPSRPLWAPEPQPRRPNVQGAVRVHIMHGDHDSIRDSQHVPAAILGALNIPTLCPVSPPAVDPASAASSSSPSFLSSGAAEPSQGASAVVERCSDVVSPTSTSESESEAEVTLGTWGEFDESVGSDSGSEDDTGDGEGVLWRVGHVPPSADDSPAHHNHVTPSHQHSSNRASSLVAHRVSQSDTAARRHTILGALDAARKFCTDALGMEQFHRVLALFRTLADCEDDQAASSIALYDIMPIEIIPRIYQLLHCESQLEQLQL